MKELVRSLLFENAIEGLGSSRVGPSDSVSTTYAAIASKKVNFGVGRSSVAVNKETTGHRKEVIAVAAQREDRK